MGNARNIAFWVVLLILVMALCQLFSGNQTTRSSRSWSYSDFIERVDAGQVAKVTLDGERIVVVGKDNSTFVAIKPAGDIVTDNLARELIAKGVEVEAEPQAQSGFVSVLLSFLPFLLLPCLLLLHAVDQQEAPLLQLLLLRHLRQHIGE